MQPVAGTTRIQKATSLWSVIFFLAVQVTDLAVTAFVSSSRMRVSVS